MSALIEERKHVKGGSFLIEESGPAEVFTPEDFTEEHRMIAETTRLFIDAEVRPRVPELEAHDWALARELVRKGGELGLIGANIPEEYGGLGLDQTSGALIGEMIGRSASFATTMGAQSGIGMLPILYFGTEEAKHKYLPQIATGEVIAAYALTEAGSGSDALAAKATARLSAEGTHYVLNGEKMWITNAGFADLFIVFAKVDGDKFSGFIVERGPGVSTGAEEHKMGIKGSSTCALILADVKTPIANLLGGVGKGHKIAFNILNIGRFKLGAMCNGGMKLALHDAVRYANERHQFGKPISSFGAIKAKLAEMAIRTWVGESMIYRTLGLIETAISDTKDPNAKLRAIEEYAAECSIIKVALSEYCNFVVDEMVQIYGGYGYSADYPAERAYRDARINRIFEGTNEINRMLIPGMLMKRAMSGQLALLPAAQNLMNEILTPSLPTGFDEEGEVLADELRLTRNAKKIALMILGTAAQKYMTALSEQQEILMGAADLIIDAYAMESAVLRAQKLAAAPGGEETAARHLDMTRVFCSDAIGRADQNARNTLAAMAEGDELRTLLAALRRFTKNTPVNTVAARQRIADALIGANRYIF